jgi:CHAT domain-containing protein/tetratricopeptide (TPR) repeat protein
VLIACPTLSLAHVTKYGLRASLVIACSFLGPLMHPQAASRAQSSAGDNQGSLFGRIIPDDCHAPSDSALAEVKSALATFQRKHDLQDEVRALILLGTLYGQSGEYMQALPYLRSALPLAKDSRLKSQVLTMTADALTAVGQPDAALRNATEALSISSTLGDVAAEASALRAQAEAAVVSSPEKAMPYLQKALPLSIQANDPRTEAVILTDEGEAVQDSSSPFDIFRQALSIEDQIHDCRDRAGTLTNLATLEFDRGQIRAGFGHFDEAVALEHQVGDHTSEAQTLHQLGYFHSEIGDLGHALSLFNQALQIKKQAGDVDSEAETLGEIAGVYRDAQWPSEALHTYLQVLPTVERTNDVPWQVIILNDMGAVEADLHHYTEARTYYNRAMQLAPSAGDPTTPAFTLWGIGELEQADALSSYFQSIRLARESEQGDLEGEVDASLMDHFRAHHQPNVAIFFGKRAIDRFQALRRNMGGMSNDLTSSFLQKKSASYRTLAEILIDQRRLIEAQQVLDLLKIQQYSDYVGEQPSELGQPLARGQREASLDAQYEDQLMRLVDLDKTLHAAENAKPKQPPAILQDRGALRAGKASFDAFLQSLYRQLEGQDGPAADVQSVTGAELPLERLISADTHAVALYTLEGVDRFRVIAITHTGRFSRSYAITQKDLDKKCQQFLDILSNHQEGVITAAQDLFGVVFSPVQKDLDAMGAETIVWDLDGSLRYIPVGALMNPQTHHYLVEDYNVVNFTPLNHSLEDVPQISGATAIGMGTSRKYDQDLEALTNSEVELDSIISDPATPNSHGVLPGAILLNGQFTEKAMEEQVKAQAVVHIASHFVLTPGNDDLSFLLLGGKDDDHSGYHFSMADFENDHNLNIEGTKLFTLSACQTGAANERQVCFVAGKSGVETSECRAGAANQREDGVVMEGMSEAVLGKGAEAVLSSLWKVNDLSTGALMADFYRRWISSGGKLTKSEALREAELDMIHETVKPAEVLSDPNAPTSFADPYFWAPFVLTGNWQ